MTDADVDAAVARLEGEVAQLLQQIPAAPGGNAAQLELLTRAQEIALNRDPTRERARLLHAARPFLPTLLHQQNAPLVAAVLALLAEAARRSAVFYGDLFDGVSTVLLLSFSSEKNVLRALDLATDALLGAFQSVVASQAPHDELAQLWAHVTTALDHAADLVATGPLALPDSEPNNNRSAAVFLRAWKLLERAVLLLTEAKDATVYRDPARSNVQPDAVSVDLVPAAGHAVLDRGQLLARGDALLRRLIDRVLLAPTVLHGVAPLTRRELCVAINSLSLVAAVRPQLMGIVMPALLACHVPDPAAGDRAVQSTLKANLVKLLSHPAAQELAEEVTECVIALQDGERAFRAISKSKDPRRKYVSAPSEASLRRARIGKRTAEQISESVEQQDHAKRARAAQQQQQQASSSSSSERITPESLVNMPSAAVLHLVLGAFAAELPPPPSANLALLLPPSELKTRMAALLAKLATPSSVLALETSIRRSRDPRRRRESHCGDAHQQPSLLAVFDDETVDEVSDWVSKNSTTAEEPLVSLAEDNSVQVFLKPVSAAWCRDMASAALARILENEYGVGIRGDDELREKLLCRLASSPWFLLTDERNATIHPSRDDARLPPVYQTLFDFVLEDVERRASLSSALLHHEYVRVTTELVQTPEDGDTVEDQAVPPRTGDVVYRNALTYFLRALVGALDLSSSSGKKLFGGVVAALPRVTVEVFRVVATLFEDPHKSAGGAVLGITVLRDLVRERKSCEQTALRVLLQYTCDRDETCRNSSIRCVANQLYVLEALKKPIEEYAIALVASLEEGAAAATTTTTSEIKDEGENDNEDVTMAEPAPASDVQGGDEVAMEATSSTSVGVADTPAPRSAWLRARLAQIESQDRGHAAELQHFANALDGASAPLALDAEVDVLRRLELFLALCAKKPALLGHVVATYGRAANELVRQVVFHAIEKLIKHLKTRSSGAAAVVAQLYGFTAPSLPLVCHVVQLLAARSSSSTTDTTADTLVPQVLALWRAHMHVADAVSVVIPVMSRVPRDSLMPLLPPLLSLPAAKWGVAMTRVFEALPPHQVLTPIDLLLALHHVDLAQDAGLQKKVIAGINFCLEHRHAFPAEVLLHVCRVLLQEPAIPKLALRTLILSVTAFPSLQHDAAQLLRGLVERRVWELAAAAEPERGDALWKGFVKCVALVQPASFPVLLDDTWFPVEQLTSVLQDEPALRGLMRAYIESPEAADHVRVSDAVRALLMEGADDEAVKEEDGAADVLKEEEAAQEEEEHQPDETVDETETAVKSEA